MHDTLLKRLLNFYHIDEKDYEELIKPYDLSNFASGHTFDDIDNAVKLVKEVMFHKGKIIIYGDYDADGIMGTSILMKMFEYLDYVSDYYIPSRYLDGYGLNMKHAEEYVNNGYELVITVDNGISAFEPIKYLKENGVKVLILDHHQVQEEVPIADAICHPTYSNFGDIASSGAFTAFIYSISLLNRVDKYLATLASISLISDMMPLKGYNRNLLRAVFASYQVGEFLPIDLLADHEQLDEVVIGMKIAPRINSIGRLAEDESVNDVVKFFISKNKDAILNYYSHIVRINEERKLLSKSTSESIKVDDNKKAIILLGEYKEGLIGLIANSLVNKYHLPTIVFTKSVDGSLKGSARAPEGFNVVESFNKLNSYLITFGGHAAAGGCSLEPSKYNDFINAYYALAESTPLEYVPHDAIDIYINELNNETYELVRTFSPFGEDWQEPLFKLARIKTEKLLFSRDNNHILTSVGNSLRLIGFNFSKDKVQEFPFVDMIGTIKKTMYKGYTYIEFHIKEIQESKN